MRTALGLLLMSLGAAGIGACITLALYHPEHRVQWVPPSYYEEHPDLTMQEVQL